MLPSQYLDKVRIIVTHKDCHDGIASAIILRDALPNARVEFVQYNTPAHRDLRATDGMLFCDMTPPPERVREFVDAGAIVLDHHKGAREIVEAFGERGVFADEATEPGVSGATLAYREVWRQIRPRQVTRQWGEFLEHFAQLAGIRDTWQSDSMFWREACAQAAALRFWPVDMLLDESFSLGQRLDIGEVLLARDEERDARSIAEAYRFEVGGIRVVAFEGLHTSDIAERLDGEADLVLGWHYAMEDGCARMVVSCRSRGAVSALALAKANGGGGHERAAGFRLPEEPYMSPYTMLQRLVETHVDAMVAPQTKPSVVGAPLVLAAKAMAAIREIKGDAA